MTKWKGQAASYAPFVTLGVCVFSAMPLDAALADCTNVGVNWTCSATTVTSQTINTNGAIVTTDPGFNLTVPSGQALTIQAQGALSYTDTNSSAIVSNGSGTALYMQATNLGATPGSTTINSNGNFTGTSGIEVENSANGHSNVTLSGQITATGAGVGVQVRSGWGDININVAPTGVITSGGIGINTDQTGPGTTTINASGEVSGDNVGIQATTGFGDIAGDITVNAGTVTGGVHGISIGNRGIGSSVLTATGPVEGTTGRGIWVENRSYIGASPTRDIIINAADVTGGTEGILVSNAGTGDTQITTTGSVEAIGGDGINASNGDQTGDLIIHSNNVTGTNSGVSAFNQGTGVTSVTTTGQVTGTNAIGIQAFNSPAGTSITVDADSVTGRLTGIRVRNFGTDITRVTAAGLVTATAGDGIEVHNTATATDITINAFDVTAENTGVVAQNLGTGMTSVTTRGQVTGNGNGITAFNMSTGTDVVVNANDVTGMYNGIYALNYGTRLTSVTATGQVTGTNLIGIYAHNGSAGTGLIVDANGVTGGQNGIQTLSEGTGDTTITADGDVVGGNSGVLAVNTGTGDHIITLNSDVTGGSGSAIDTQTLAGNHTELAINGGTISAASGTAILNNEGDFDAVVTEPTVVVGSVQLANGTDNLSFDLSDISQLTVLDGGDDVSVADGMIDTLTFAGVNGTVTGGNLLNWERIVVDYGTTLDFSDSALTTSADPDMGLFINDGGALIAVSGVFTLTGNATNAGFLLLDDGTADDTFVIKGNYAGNGGTVMLDTALGNDASPTDQLVVNGDTSGSSYLEVWNVGGEGSPTTNGIKVIDVVGTSNGHFELSGDYFFQGEEAVIGGAYAYRLYKNGVSTPNDGDWYLRSTLVPCDETGTCPPLDCEEFGTCPPPLPQAGVPTFETYPQVLLGLNTVPTLQQRAGNRFWSGNGAGVASQGADAAQEQAPVPEDAATLVEGRGFWGRIEASHTQVDPKVATTVSEYDFDIFKVQAGLDAPLHEDEAGVLVGGLTVHYGHASSDASSFYGNGDIKTDGYGFGGTVTWYGKDGLYVDAQGQLTWYDSDLNSDDLGQLANGNNGFGYTLSVEGGQRIELSNSLALTPQAQLVYSSVDFDDFTQTIDGRDAADVSLLDGDSLRGRLGVTLDKETSWQADNGLLSRSNVYGVANLYYEFLDGTAVNVSGVSFSNRGERLWGGIGAGGSYNWNDDKYSLYGEGSVNTSLANFADSYELKGTAGFRVRW